LASSAPRVRQVTTGTLPWPCTAIAFRFAPITAPTLRPATRPWSHRSAPKVCSVRRRSRWILPHLPHLSRPRSRLCLWCLVPTGGSPVDFNSPSRFHRPVDSERPSTHSPSNRHAAPPQTRRSSTGRQTRAGERLHNTNRLTAARQYLRRDASAASGGVKGV
jgi:hypothetical protein